MLVLEVENALEVRKMETRQAKAARQLLRIVHELGGRYVGDAVACGPDPEAIVDVFGRVEDLLVEQAGGLEGIAPDQPAG